MRYAPLLAGGLACTLLLASPLRAASALLEKVKQNPEMAKTLCARFKQFNAEGKSATSPESLQWVAAKENLSMLDAEVLSTYVIGLNCSDVR